MSNIISFASMDILDNGPGSTVLTGPTRVVDIDFCKQDPIVWLIDCVRPHSSQGMQRKGYFCMPYRRSLAEINKYLSSAQCVVLKVQPPAAHTLKDADRLANCKTEGLRAKLLKQLEERDKRFTAIRPLVCVPDSNIPRRVSEVMADDGLARQIDERAEEYGHASSTLRNWMNRFWSGGCQKNALIAGYDRCGNPGQAKKQNKKLGRSPRLYITNHWATRGYPLSEQDKRRLSHGFSLITRERTPRDAYLLTSASHWAHHEVTPTGEVRAALFPKELRPSFDQFMRWGAKLVEKTAWELIIGDTKWRQQHKTVGSSERDTVIAIGQQAFFDGTSTDVYLVSFRNRLNKLPPLTRLILKEARTGMIYGVYCGWEAPSPRTAQLAILHGALKDKSAWARRFGVEIDKESIPGLLARHMVADNGELKSNASTEAEEQFGFGISYTPASRGDTKGSVETEHKRMHAHLDHRLPGSTHGKPRSRGQAHPAADALWNYAEYMRELIRWIVWHNTVEEVPDLAPDDMLLSVPRIAPTRHNIYHWLDRKGLNASLNVDYEALRAFTLPDIEAVVAKNGIRLIGCIHGRKTRLLRLRYTSQELAQTGLLTQVKVTGKEIPTRVKMDPSDLSQAWLPTRAGMIRVTHSVRDQSINKNLTLDEWESYCEEQAVLTDLSAGDREQHRTDTILRQSAITESAKAEVKSALATLRKKPSRVALVSNLELNRRHEIELLRMQDQESDASINDEETTLEIHAIPDAADEVMAAFWRNNK